VLVDDDGFTLAERFVDPCFGGIALLSYPTLCVGLICERSCALLLDSHAIMRYLATTRRTADSWYGTNSLMCSTTVLRRCYPVVMPLLGLCRTVLSASGTLSTPSDAPVWTACSTGTTGMPPNGRESTTATSTSRPSPSSLCALDGMLSRAIHVSPVVVSSRTLLCRALRRGCARTTFYHAFSPMLGVTPPKAAVKEDLGILKRALRVMEGWLSEHKWIAGDEASIADIRCVS
jgi:hypothetical protein